MAEQARDIVPEEIQRGSTVQVVCVSDLTPQTVASEALLSDRRPGATGEVRGWLFDFLEFGEEVVAVCYDEDGVERAHRAADLTTLAQPREDDTWPPFGK